MTLRAWLLAASGVAAVTACASGGPSNSALARNDPIRSIMSADVMMLVSFDTDGDARVTGPEIDAGLDREFHRADANGDGSLAPIEFSNWSALVLGGSQMGPYRLDFDRNVDNTITREEFDTEIRARVHDYDADGDGVLLRSEFIRLVGQARPPAPPRRPVVLPPSS